MAQRPNGLREDSAEERFAPERASGGSSGASCCPMPTAGRGLVAAEGRGVKFLHAYSDMLMNRPQPRRQNRPRSGRRNQTT